MPEPAPVIDQSAVVLALNGPVGLFIESGCPPPVRPHALTLVVRTDTAFRLPVAAIIVGALRERLDLRHEIAESIELAVHEGVANAIIHGNLGMDSNGRSNPDDYDYFCTLLEERLQDPVAAARLIQVMVHWTRTAIVLAITDEGSGFTPRVLSNPTEALSGRGLALVRAFASNVRWNQRRRQLVLLFKIVAEST